jgi:hypothetical protein
MQNNKKLWILVLVIVVATIGTSIVSFQTQGQDKTSLTNTNQKDSSKLEQKRKEFDSQFQTAQYDAPEEADPEKKTKRKLKNKRYDNRGGLVSNDMPVDEGEERMLITHSDSIAGLPASESEIVVVGEVLDAQAYVSNNKKGVYSEFTVRVNEILKNNSTNVAKGSLISVDREGGFVEYKNGKTRLHRIGGQGMPRVGQRYVLFLKNPEKSPNYEIITGYELKADGVANLNGDEQFRAYAGMDEAAFMKAVRQAIAQSSPAVPEKEE